MRIASLALLALPLGSQAFVPHQSRVTSSRATSLHERKEQDSWFGPAAAAVAGWTLATQIAFANPVVVPTQLDAPSQTKDSPTLLVAGFGGVETMDFSMPSYGEATKGDTTGVKEAPNIPAFNPFGMGSSKEEEAAPASDAADEKAAAEAKKADDKAAAEAKKAEEKAAAEAKKEEEKAAAEAKKAEKEARRKAELEKQKEAVERAKQKKAEEDAAASASEDMSAPEISIPSFSAPEMPEVKLPEVKVPEMPKMSFSMPKIDMPKLDLPDKDDIPKFEAPKAPEFSAPKVPEFSAPKAPEFSAPKLPEFSAPKIPEFSAPKVSIPSFDTPKSSGGYDFDAPTSSSFSSPEEDVEPQEIRDARAKEGRSVFVDADNEAKEVERQARALRDIANEKKKIAKELKDDACKTRIGGKFLCLRPLNSGY